MSCTFFTSLAFAQEEVEDAAPDQQSSKSDLLKNSASVITRNEFWINADNRYFLVLEYGRKIKNGDLLFRTNTLFRSGFDGTLYEVDYYPVFDKKSYGFFNVSYSGSILFPNWRTAAEYFRSFAERWEFSIGARTIHPDNYNIWVATGTIGMYPGNFYVYFRPTFSFLDDGLATSGMISARWYWGEHTSFYELTLIRGTDTGTVRDFNAIENSFGLETYVIRGKVRYNHNPKWQLEGGIDYSGIFIPARDGYIDIISFDVGLKRYF